MAKIRFSGSKEFGYTAEQGLARCRVLRGADGWTAYFMGSVAKRNPWVTLPEGGRSRSCSCPKVDVDGVFKSRKAAAEEGLRLYRVDDAFAEDTY